MDDRAQRDFPDGGRIKTFPFPAGHDPSGAGMRVGPMGDHEPWRADIPLEGVHRVGFHVVLLFGGGPVRHMVDFTAYEVGTGDLLWFRPGQVHRFSRVSEYRGTALTMQPGFLPRETVEAARLHRYDLPPPLRPRREAIGGPARLVDAAGMRAPRHGHTSARSAHRRVEAFPDGLPAAPRPSGRRLHRGREPARRRQVQPLPDAVERDFAADHGVSAYADALGCSRRTLGRADRAATGGTPKGVHRQSGRPGGETAAGAHGSADRPRRRGRRFPRRGQLLRGSTPMRGAPSSCGSIARSAAEVEPVHVHEVL